MTEELDALQKRLDALKADATDECLHESGRYFHDRFYRNLTSCAHGDTGEFSCKEDGQAIALLWNFWRSGGLTALRARVAELEALLADAYGAELNWKEILQDAALWQAQDDIGKSRVAEMTATARAEAAEAELARRGQGVQVSGLIELLLKDHEAWARAKGRNPIDYTSKWRAAANTLHEMDESRIRAALVSPGDGWRDDPAKAFDNADWFWRTMDPDDCGDSPEEAINRAMVGQFCVCEIASSYSGPTRYGFIAPVLDPDSDDEEFVHFATQEEAIAAAKARSAPPASEGTDHG